MMMMRSNRGNRDYGMRNNMKVPMSDNYGMRDNYEMDSKFRDRRGREHYDNGRFAPRSEWEARIVGDHYGDYDMESLAYPMESRETTRRNMDERKSSTSRGNYAAKNEMPKMNRIGFYTGEEIRSDYGSRLDAPVWNEGDKMKGGKMHKGRAMSYGGAPLDEESAEKWMERLKNADGTTGPHWTKEQVKGMMAQKSIDHDLMDIWVAMNMFYSDYCKVAKKLNVSNVNFYLDMALAFLNDEDAVDDKLAAYYECVVKHE